METTTQAIDRKKVATVTCALVGGTLSCGLTALVIGQRTFNHIVHRDVGALLAQSRGGNEVLITEAMLEGLPDPVWRYLRYTGVVGKPLVRTVRLKQHGKMRSSASGGWLPLDAEQFYSVQPPGFVWDGTLHVGPLPVARARDRYADGRGNMRIRAGGIYPIADASGAEMDQGSMMRYLSEMIWFPTAFLGDNTSFTAIDAQSAQVTLTDHGRTASGTLYFDAEGRLTGFLAQRYRMVGGGYELATWWAPVTEYGELAGLKLPVRAQAVWKLPEGDLAYFDTAITELEYNVTPEPAITHTTEDAA
jgi:hypothetical protein